MILGTIWLLQITPAYVRPAADRKPMRYWARLTS
jgi:hypothetical protein